MSVVHLLCANQECGWHSSASPHLVFCLTSRNDQTQFKSREAVLPRILPMQGYPRLSVGRNFHLSGIQDEDIDVSWKSLINTAQRQVFSTYVFIFPGILPPANLRGYSNISSKHRYLAATTFGALLFLLLFS